MEGLKSEGANSFSFTGNLACVAGVRRGGKGERRASEMREDWMRKDRGN